MKQKIVKLKKIKIAKMFKEKVKNIAAMNKAVIQKRKNLKVIKVTIIKMKIKLLMKIKQRKVVIKKLLILIVIVILKVKMIIKTMT